jgi:hypothetical protein
MCVWIKWRKCCELLGGGKGGLTDSLAWYHISQLKLISIYHIFNFFEFVFLFLFFKQMMSKTADKRFLMEKDIELKLAERHPEVYVSRYALITHSLLPYRLCQGVGEIQSSILSELSENISKADEVNLEMADQLIEEKLVPFLEKHGITAEKCLYTSPYYEKASDRTAAAAAEASS